MHKIVEDFDRGVQIETIIEGTGPDVVLLPSALRGAEDFAQLQADLAKAGFRSVAVNPRNVGKSRASETTPTLRDFANDVASVITQLCGGRSFLVGHALGNVLARATASYRPETVRAVACMPSAGHSLGAHPVPANVLQHFLRCHDASLSDEERCESLSIAFFAPGNDPSSWLQGWWPGGGALAAALAKSDPEEWWRAGNAPLLIMQPLNDPMAPRAVGQEVAAALSERATYVEIPQCGHAILPEQPALVAEHIIRFMQANEHR